jgi:hypothetical protein
LGSLYHCTKPADEGTSPKFRFSAHNQPFSALFQARGGIGSGTRANVIIASLSRWHRGQKRTWTPRIFTWRATPFA